MKRIEKEFLEEFALYHEMTFGYNGTPYTIDYTFTDERLFVGKLYTDEQVFFSDIHDLLDHYMIDGKPLRALLPDLDYFAG